LHLSSGAQQRLDLKIGEAPSVTLRPNINVALYRADLPRLQVSASDTGDYANNRWPIRNVPPGNYIVYSIAGGRSGFHDDPGTVVRQPIAVASQPLALELRPVKRGRIDVHLRGDDGRALDESAAAVSFFPFDDMTPVDHYSLTGLDHTFDPGAYWLSIRPKPPFCVISQTLAGGTLVNGKVTVTPAMSARLELELGSACGVIDIRAVSNGAPVPFASFLLLVNGTRREPGDVITGNMDTGGHASIPNMSPGRYLLWAWAPNADGYLGPDLADPAIPPVEVVVRVGQPALVSIDPLRPPGAPK
jgi:hypothetical protein